MFTKIDKLVFLQVIKFRNLRKKFKVTEIKPWIYVLIDNNVFKLTSSYIDNNVDINRVNIQSAYIILNLVI